MSWCRWSTDDYRCDLYIYESDCGWSVNTGANRYVFAGELPAPVDLQPGFTTEQFDDFVQRQRAVSAMIQESVTEPIGLSRDGRTWILDSPGEVADLLVDLAAEGYLFPPDLIPALREEQKDRDQAENNSVLG